MGDNIHIILTGGTIEKTYDPLTEKPEFCCQSILPDYLYHIIKARPYLSFNIVAQIDSLDMTDEIRDDIAKAVISAPSHNIIIVHGTSTMEDTAQYLNKELKNTDKTIILTGGMIPLKEFAMSDSGFNLGYAMAKIQNTEQGVYIAMNAALFRSDNVTKDTKTGRFENIKEKI